MLADFDAAVLLRSLPVLWNGMLLTLQLTAMAVVGGLLLGIVLAGIRLSKRGFNSPVHRDLGAGEGVKNFLR